MISARHYKYDSARKLHKASLDGGAVLFRLASLSHWERDFILNGGGAANNPNSGRFNRPYQRTSYCANNILICLAERLFHMHSDLIEALGKGHPYDIAAACCSHLGRLVVFSLESVEDLVFVDSKAAQVDYDGRMAGTGVVCPARIYSVLHDVAEKMRGQGKQGVIYPSARHSQGVAVAFFGDKTPLVRPDPYHGLDVRLRLVAEDQDFNAPAGVLDPYDQKVHSNVGSYEVLNEPLLDDLRAKGLLDPIDLPKQGYIEFFRKTYSNYPVDALRVF